MIQVIDNYDSFTYNIVQYLFELGAEVNVIRNDQATVEELIARQPQAFVLSPGPGRPENAGILNLLIAQIKGTIPIFGVCLGLQAIGQVYGASIVHAPSLMHGKTSMIRHTGARLFASVPNPFQATRYHSLIVDRSTLSSSFSVTAETEDGLIMAIEHTTWPIHAVQFHPESIMTPDGKTMIGNFLALVR